MKPINLGLHELILIIKLCLFIGTCFLTLINRIEQLQTRIELIRIGFISLQIPDLIVGTGNKKKDIRQPINVAGFLKKLQRIHTNHKKISLWYCALIHLLELQ